MRFLRPIPAGLVLTALLVTWAGAEPFNLQHGERPAGWRVVGGNTLAWRFLNNALNSGNGDEEGYVNPSYFFKDSPGNFSMKDYRVTARVRSTQENGTFTLLARFQDPQDYYGLEYRDHFRGGRVRLVKVKDGDIRYEKSVGHGFRYDDRVIPELMNEVVAFRIEARGNRIKAWVNDDYEMEIQDGDFQNGTTGFANFFYNVEILDFTVTPLAPEAGEGDLRAGAGDGRARIEFRETFTEREARALKDYLDSQQFANVEILEEDGKWIVRTAPYPSSEQAQVLLNVLEADNITGGVIVPVEEPAAPSPAAPGFVHAVVVAEYDDLEAANVHKNSLTEAGFSDVRLGRDQVEGTYQVLFGTFESEELARDAAAQMNATGFTTQGTIAVPRTTTTAAVDVEDLTQILLQKILPELSAGAPDQGEVEDALSKYSDLLQTMEERDDIIARLENKIEQLTKEQAEASSAREEAQQQELDRLLREAEEHLNNNELDDARIKTNMALQIDPLNPDARVNLEQIRLKELDVARTEARAEREAEINSRLGEARRLVAQGSFDDARMQLNAILGMGTRVDELSESARKDLAETRDLLETVNRLRMETEMEKLNRLEVQARERGDLERVLIFLESKARLDPDNPQIIEEIKRVSDELKKRGGSDKRQKFILFGLVVFVALFALFYFLTSFLQRRQEAALAAREEEILQVTYEPAEDNFQEEEPSLIEETISLNFGGLVPLGKEQKALAQEGPPQEPPAQGSGVAVAEPPQAPAADTGGAEEKEPPEQEPPAVPPVLEEDVAPPLSGEKDLVSAEQETDRGYGSLDDLLSEEEDHTDMAPSFGDLDLLEPVGTEEETPAAGDLGPAGTEALEPEGEETSTGEPAGPQAAPAPLGGAMLPEPVEGNLLFKQGFDKLNPGTHPENWEAQGMDLSVAGEGKGGIGRCLRVEKSPGGGALARCRFPGIKNIFRTEFDIKSEAGIEGELKVSLGKEDEAPDLVQVQAGGGGQELILQGTKTPSEPGEWRHVKFIINLDKQVVNGFVDGKLVAYKVVLDSAPSVVDSISIRGDEAAGGAILVDNIRIYRV